MMSAGRSGTATVSSGGAASCVVASAPGSIMIMGEHAVLRGQPALVGSVQHRVTIRIEPRCDATVHIRSALGQCSTSLDALDLAPPFQFVGATLAAVLESYTGNGFDLDIAADMPPDVGLGSSAAVTVAMYAGLNRYVTGVGLEPAALWLASREIIRRIQGRGSGADVAASVYGGILCYTEAGGVRERITDSLPEVCLYYVGYKTPTARVIEIVEEARSMSPGRFLDLDVRMGQSTQQASDALRRHDVEGFALSMCGGQGVMEEYGVCDANLQELITLLRQQASVRAVKISGSGLGDCVLVLGQVPDAVEIPFRRIPVVLGAEGVRVEQESGTVKNFHKCV